MQITQKHIDWLTSEWVDQAIIDKAQAGLNLELARQATGKAVFQMNELFQLELQKGTYDDILGDVNAIIDRTQTLMQPNQEENA